MNISLAQLRLNLSKQFSQEISYVSAPCGSGKSTAACKLIANQLIKNTNIMVVLPTKVLVDEIEAGLIAMNVKPTKITQNTTKNSVRRMIMKRIETAADAGSVLLVTWNGYLGLPYFPNRHNWTIIIDEVPAVDEFKTFRLPKNYKILTNWLDVNPSKYPCLYHVTAKGKTTLNKVMEGKIDDVDEIFRGVCKLVASNSHEVFVNKDEWDAVLSKKDRASGETGTMSFLSMLNARLFKDTILIGANAEDSLLYQWLETKHDCKFIKNQAFNNGLRFTKHALDHRAKISYFSEGNTHSKYAMNKLLPDGRLVADLMDAEAIKLLGSKSFLYVENNDRGSKLLKDHEPAQKISVSSHGLNCYDHFNAIYISAALNRSPKHCQMLQAVGLTKAMLVTATAHETYYQSIMRTSLRKVDTTAQVSILVPDKASAIRIASLLGVTQTERIALPELSKKSPYNQTEKNNRSKRAKLYQQLVSPESVPNSYGSVLT